MLSQTSTIDLAAEGPQGWELLIVVEAGEWHNPRARWLLQEKVNTYSAYALDGEMHQQFPESQAKPVSIVIRPVDPVPADVEALISKITAILQPEGLAVSVEPLPAEPQAA